MIEQNRALLEQDDRIAPESDEKLGELLSHKELQHYPRQPGADAGMEKFKDKIGNPVIQKLDSEESPRCLPSI